VSIGPKGQGDGPMILGEREVGKFRPKAWDLAREMRQQKGEEDRNYVRRLAMIQATLTKYRDPLARKMYEGQGIGLEDWPALELLTPKERTDVIKDVRHIFGLRADGKKL
jgi:hypothetical protein